MCLNDCVLPEDVLNEEEQTSNSLIQEKSKGRYLKSNGTIKQLEDLNKVTTKNKSVMLACFHELVSDHGVSFLSY
jgi:hypothetical protein